MCLPFGNWILSLMGASPGSSTSVRTKHPPALQLTTVPSWTPAAVSQRARSSVSTRVHFLRSSIWFAPVTSEIVSAPDGTIRTVLDQDGLKFEVKRGILARRMPEDKSQG